MSTPVRGRTKAEKQAARKAKNAKKTSHWMIGVHAARRPVDAPAQEAHDGEHPHAELFQRMLALLQKHKTTFAEFMFYIMDPVYKQGVHRYHGFLHQRKNIDRFLSLMGRKSRTIRQHVQEWALGRVTQSMHREARLVTSIREFQTSHRSLGGAFFVDFSFARIKDRIRQLMPTTTAIFSVTVLHIRRVARIILQGLSEWSQKNNILKKVFGLYMYATGSQRQQIEVLSHVGLTETYSTLVDKKRKKKRKKKAAAGSAQSTLADITINDVEAAAEKPESARHGTLHQLSDDMKAVACDLADAIVFGATYDNINVMSRVVEQIIGRTDAQENGTCATIYALWKAALNNMKAKTLLEAFDAAEPLAVTDILQTESEAIDFRLFLIHTILCIIVLQGGDSFKEFRSELSKKQPQTEDKIDVHKSVIQPTPAWKIDQSSITGNAEFIEVFYEYLGIRSSPEFSTWVRLIIGDQLSIARLRSLLNIRAGQEGGAGGFRNFVLVPGLFHAKIADTHGFFTTHWGKVGTANRVPGSLWYHNTLLHRLPITLTSLPPFRTCRDLIWVSLYARVFDCLLLVTGKQSIEDIVTTSTTFDELLGYATSIYDRFLDIDTVDELRTERRFAIEKGLKPNDAQKGDMVYENASLFLRDALISREYADAIKCGDSGRVMLVLKIWALSYRGSGRSKYAYEMLSLIHHVTKVWPKPIVKIVFNNWLLNTTGNPNSFLEGDLLQEHMNFWIKTFYKAHGSNASWQWLEMLAPCMVVLRNLTRSLNGLLGADLGTKHKSPDLTNDIAVLMDRLRQYEVHTIKRGRVIAEDDGGPATDSDIISAGLATLVDAATNPIDEYNTAFQTLQRRCKQPVLVPAAETPEPTSSMPNPATARVPLADVDEPMPVSEAQEDETHRDGEEEEQPDEEVEEEDEETLTLDTQEDVELEMDDLGGAVDPDSEASDGSSSEDETE
ncbi:hypothetical protein C8F01DRAFT_1217523 [Mycena amicta]|nr:hypothetical protein C8F01DRAFT_1217523 [Mycena amicta]